MCHIPEAIGGSYVNWCAVTSRGHGSCRGHSVWDVLQRSILSAPSTSTDGGNIRIRFLAPRALPPGKNYCLNRRIYGQCVSLVVETTARCFCPKIEAFLAPCAWRHHLLSILLRWRHQNRLRIKAEWVIKIREVKIVFEGFRRQGCCLWAVVIFSTWAEL